MDKDIYIKNLQLPYIEKHVNLCIKRGLNYLKGNNGTGKTLMLDYISGIRKDKKAVIRGNESILYINQSIFFSDRLLCEDFLKFVYRMEGNIREVNMFEQFIERFTQENQSVDNVKKLLKKQWGMLSGGERKLIYILILMSIDREWYILDEPFAFLDTMKKNIIWEVIDEKIGEGKGIITAVHNDRTIILKGDDIYLIRIENEKTVLYGKEKSYVSKKRLCELEKALKPNFMKISKTTLINLKYIEGMEASFGGMMLLIMKNGCKDYVSRKYLPDLKKYLGL